MTRICKKKSFASFFSPFAYLASSEPYIIMNLIANLYLSTMVQNLLLPNTQLTTFSRENYLALPLVTSSMSQFFSLCRNITFWKI